MRLFPSLWRWVPALGILLTVSYPGTAQELPDPALVIAEVLNPHDAPRLNRLCFLPRLGADT